MGTSKIETEFRKQVNKTSKETITDAISDVSYVFDQLKTKYQSLSKSKKDAYVKIAEFLDKLKKIKKSMQEIKRIDFLNLSNEQQRKQREYNDKIQKLQEAISILNLDIISFSQSPLYDDETKRIFDSLTIRVLNQENLDILMNSVSIANGDIDKKILDHEQRIREQLSKSMGESAFQITIPQFNYNPLGNINSSSKPEQVANILQRNLQPFENIEQGFVDLVQKFRQQVKDAKADKSKREYEALQIIESQIKQLTLNENGEAVDELIKDFEKQLQSAIQEAQNSYGQTTLYEYSNELKQSIVNGISSLMAKQKALVDMKNILRSSRLDDHEKRILQIDMLKNAIITLEENKADVVVEYLNAVGEIVTDGSSKFLEKQHKDLMDSTSAVYLNISSEIQANRMKTLGSTKLSTNMYDTINPFANNKNGYTFVSKLRNDKYLQLIKNTQYNNQFLNSNLKGFLQNPVGANSPIDPNIDIRVVTPMISKAAQSHIDLLSETNVNGLTYKLTSAEEKQSIDNILQSSKEMVAMIDKALVVFDKIKKDDVDFNLLKEQKRQLEKHIDHIENVKRSMDGLSRILSFVSTVKDKMIGAVKAGLGLLGIGAILHPMRQLMMATEKMTEMGKYAYSSSISDISMGLDISFANNMSLSYGIPKFYFDLTHGQIGFGTASNFYRGLVKNVGGQYGGGSQRGDLNFFTRNLMADKELYQIDDGNIQSFLKTFYKDMNISARETLTALRSLEGFAISSNVPMNKLFGTINSMTETMRALGVSSEVLLNSVTSLSGWNGFRIEDASEMVSAIANAASGMSKDWGRNLFWGLMSEESADVFGTLLSGSKTHNAKGAVNDEYIDTMVDRLFAESIYYNRNGDSIWSFDMMNRLMDIQGLTRKQASVLTQLQQEGKLDEFKKRLKGYVKLNDENASEITTKELSEQLGVAAGQISELKKIQSTFTSFIYNIAHIIDKNLSDILNDAEKWLHKQITKYEKVMRGLIMATGGFFKTSIGKKSLDFFAENPFTSMAGLLVAGGLARYGIRSGGKTLMNVFRGKQNVKALNPFIGSVAVGGGIGAYATEMGMYEMEHGEEEVDHVQVLGRMLQDGRAVARIISGKELQDKQDDYIATIAGFLFATSSPILAYMFAKAFFNYRTMQRYNRLFDKIQVRVESPKLAYPNKTRELRKLEKRLKKEKQLNKKNWNRYLELKRAYEAKLKAYKTRLRENAKIRRNNRMVSREYRARVARRAGRIYNRSKAASYRNIFGLNMMIDFLRGDNEHSIGARTATTAIESVIMGVLGKKLGVVGSFVGFGLPQYTHDPLASSIDSFFGTKTEAAVALQHSSDDIKKMSEDTYASNSKIAKDSENAFASHGRTFESLTEREKILFNDKYRAFLTIVGDYKKAISHAASFVCTYSSNISYSGGIKSGAQLFQQLAENDSATAKIMQDAAQKFGVPVEDLAVIANIESGMNPNIGTNSAGATGIMQNTSDHGTGYDIYTTQGNIYAGAYYYKSLLDYFKGDKAKALAGYNWGPAHDAFDLNDWYNHLPKESSDYLVQAGLATGEFHNLTLTGGNSVSVQTNAPTPNVPGNQIGANWSKWLGQRMINGAEGCVEAVTKIGAEYSPFLAEELSKGTVYVPTLVANAGNRVIPFNPNALQRGDVIVYGDNDHVVIADGNGGYIGNSTSQEQIVADTNYYAMGGLTPTKIIKTGGGAFSTGNGGVGIYQQKPQTLKESFEDSIKAYQKAIGSVGTKTGKIVSGMYVNTNEKFDSIENDIKRIREQRQLASTFSIEEDKKATDVYLNHQEQAVQSIQEREVLLTAKQKKTKKIKTIVEKLQSIVGEYFDNPQVVCDI